MMHARGAVPVSCSVLLDLKSRNSAGNVQVNNKRVSIWQAQLQIDSL